VFTVHRLKSEDRALNPLEDWDVFDDVNEALVAFQDFVVDPDENIGSVYVTEDDGYQERVIAARYVL
jgi:hypothetical protein